MHTFAPPVGVPHPLTSEPRTMDLRGRHIYLLDNLSAIPKRRLRAILKACGAIVVGHVTWHAGRLKIPVDAVIYGTGTLERDAPRWPNAPSIRDTWYELEVIEALGLELSQQARFERLRELVHDDIDDDDWYQVCCLLEVWPNDSSLGIAVDYVRAHTEAAPAHRLVGLPRWLLRVASGHQEPRLEVVRHAVLPRRSLGSAASPRSTRPTWSSSPTSAAAAPSRSSASPASSTPPAGLAAPRSWTSCGEPTSTAASRPSEKPSGKEWSSWRVPGASDVALRSLHWGSAPWGRREAADGVHGARQRRP